MKVYKYRGVSELDRDLNSLQADYFFAPTADKLNDPVEVVLNSKVVATLTSILSDDLTAALEQMTNMRRTVGIYSLSRTPTDELMWAHYAQSHAGFCIEYDLDRLILDARTQWTKLDVVYSQEPPSLEIGDLIGVRDATGIETKLAGHKSIRWSYEEELRILTARSGKNYYARSAVTGIYFGCRASHETISRVRTALARRSHKYFVLQYPEHSYRLEIKELPRDDSLDGLPRSHYAPIEEHAVPVPDELGKDAHRHGLLLRAVECVRRDPACEKVVLAGVSTSVTHPGKLFVQYKTRVQTDLCDSVNMYFDDNDLSPQCTQTRC